MNKPNWILYGANGYTGRIVAEHAVAAGMKPILAGRRESEVKPLAESLGLQWRCFDLQNQAALEKNISDCALVLLCAGPFSATSAPMVQACLQTQTHYLDITGEITVFEAIQALDTPAKKNHVVLMPGVGFDVVPTDCLAAMLKQQLPDATHLQLAFSGDGGISPGTSKTMVQMLGDRCQVRRDGKRMTVPAAYKRKMIRFSHQSLYCMTIPWGDISTAYYSTQIPNIEVYTAVPRAMAIMSRLFNPLMGLIAKPAVQDYLNRLIEKHVHGPDAATRAAGCSRLSGVAHNATGVKKELLLDVAEGYEFTARSCIACVQGVLAGKVPPGTWTPSMAFGADFVLQIEGSRLAKNALAE